ncbi:MAG: hypothetical protein JWQ38_2152 [Flavipsychrobacter sp.]|nr:hypothetical protein [Flavipsychrobacter sp.]
MSNNQKQSLGQKIKSMFGKKLGKCIAVELSPGKWYCHTWDGGVLVQCPGMPPFNSQAECEAAKCNG